VSSAEDATIPPLEETTMPIPLTLPWGHETIGLSLPDNWHIAATLKPASLVGAADPKAAAEAALRSPVGLPRLCELARPGIKIALVIDDISRPTPVSLIFPAVLAELQAGGVTAAQITVVPALGLHRPMSDAEVYARLGSAATPDIKIETRIATTPPPRRTWALPAAAHRCCSTRPSPPPAWLFPSAASSRTLSPVLAAGIRTCSPVWRGGP
jgi:hypothetical protein